MEQFSGIPLSGQIRVTRLISVFQYEFPVDFINAGERHDSWEFVFVKQGSICAHAENASYILKSGEMVCHRPMEFHALRPNQANTCAIILCFQCQGLELQAFHDKILTVTHRQKQYLNDLVLFAKKLLLPKDPMQITADGGMDRIATATEAQEQCVRNTIELLILSLMESDSTKRSKRAEHYELASLRRTLTSDIISYLNENLSESIHLSDLTNHFPYSLSSIKRIFKYETGCTIIDYLNHLRISKAQELLGESDYSVEIIASMVGYSSVSYFSTLYKQRTGKAPSKYRQDVQAAKLIELQK